MTSNLRKAIADLQEGRPIIIVDENTRENEGDLVIAAQCINEYNTNFMIKHTSGIICVATTKEQLAHLRLPRLQSQHHTIDPLSTPFTLSCEASSGITTGVSAKDRARTIKIIGNPKSTYTDLVAPGHVFPLEAHEKGLSGRSGHTEASVALCKLASLWPAAAISEIPSETGSMLKGQELESFAKTYGLTLVSVQEVAQATEELPCVQKLAEAKLPTEHGDFTISVWREDGVPEEHIVLSKGNITGQENVPVRLHSQCLTGDVFHSKKCDCGTQLSRALNYIAKRGYGLFLWLRQEGRGIGLVNKIKAYHLQDTKNLNTIEANLALNLPEDARDFRSSAEIIKAFQPKSIDLLTNNPNKISEMTQYLEKIVVHRHELFGKVTQENIGYLKTKKNDMHHLLDVDDK